MRIFHKFLGVILSRLEGKLLEIRSYHINWESYHQGNMISQADFQFISHYDKQNVEGKKQLFEKDPEQVSIKLFIIIYLNLLNITSKHLNVKYFIS